MKDRLKETIEQANLSLSLSLSEVSVCRPLQQGDKGGDEYHYGEGGRFQPPHHGSGRIIKLGNYIDTPGNRKRPNASKGNIYSTEGVAPCLLAGMGGGGNIVPTVLLWKEDI